MTPVKYLQNALKTISKWGDEPPNGIDDPGIVGVKEFAAFALKECDEMIERRKNFKCEIGDKECNKRKQCDGSC